MGASIDWVVDMEVGPEGSAAQAKKVLDFLLAEKIILPTTRESKGRRGMPLFNPGPDAESWSIQVCHDIHQCGLEVLQERTVFHAGDNGLDGFRCPSCGVEHSAEDVPWSDAVGAWYEGKPNDRMSCPACNAEPSIIDWTFLQCEWSFGNLGFGFNNWSITERLANAIGEVLGHRFGLVNEHI
jgi:hypothetical protein